MRLTLAILLGKLLYFATRILKKGGGSAAPGLYALKIEPNLISSLASQIPQNIIITGTNGKTTTARLLDHMVKTQNLKIIRNSTGSNLERGVASALIDKANIFGQIKDVDLGIWELDEAAFNTVLFQLKPQIIVFLNAFRDQLDRYGEVDSIIKKWLTSLEKLDWEVQIIINGDDNSTAKLANSLIHPKALFRVKNYHPFGEKSEVNLIQKAEFEATIKKNKGLSGSEIILNYPSEQLNINLPIPGLYHTYDFLAAFASYYYLNLPLDKISDSLKNFSPAFGRVEQIKLGDNQGYIFLIKNPAGASLVFETIEPEVKKDDRLLIALNDNFADGTDISWIWDADFELLESSLRAQRSNLVCSGTRAEDLALRLKYAGVDSQQIQIEPDLSKAFKLCRQDLSGRLFILPTYTALLELQSILANSKIKAHYWKENQ